MWLKTQRFPQASPFTGGVLDSWPNLLSEVLALGNAEAHRVRAYQQSEVARG